MILMDGTALARDVRAQVKEELEALGRPEVCLATLLVGDDAPSRRYVASKQKQAAEVGIRSRHTELPPDASQHEVEAVVRQLAADPNVHAILVQLPLPAHLDPHPVIDLIPPEKDVDGLTAVSLGRLLRGERGLVPCTPRGVLALLERYEVPIRGRRAVVIGRSTLVGLPVSLLLARKGVDATVTLAHSRTQDLPSVAREADILISAAGIAHLVTPAFVRPGAAVIDVGVSRTEAGIVGDVDFDAVAEVAGWLTPMPGGTGPMTVACLLENTVDAGRLQGVVPPGVLPPRSV